MNNYFDIWFSRVEVSNSIKINLLKNFTTEEIYKFKKENFEELGLREKSYMKFLTKEYKEKISNYEKILYKNEIKLIYYKEKEYPEILKNIVDFPAYIFVKRKYRFTK